MDRTDFRNNKVSIPHRWLRDAARWTWDSFKCLPGLRRHAGARRRRGGRRRRGDDGRGRFTHGQPGGGPNAAPRSVRLARGAEGRGGAPDPSAPRAVPVGQLLPGRQAPHQVHACGDGSLARRLRDGSHSPPLPRRHPPATRLLLASLASLARWPSPSPPPPSTCGPPAWAHALRSVRPRARSCWRGFRAAGRA